MILIQGAGIAGLTLARELQRRGIDYRIVERAPQLQPIGTGITLATNALKCLRQSMDITALAALGQPIRNTHLCDAAGGILSAFPMSLPDDAFPALAIHRGELQAALLDGLPAEKIILGRTIESFDSTDDKIHVKLSSGEEMEADFLVGADGAHSQIRAWVDASARRIFSGYASWRAVVRHRLANPDLLMEMWGAGKRLGYMQITPDEVYVYATLSVSGREYAGKRTQRTAKELKRLFAEFTGEAAVIVDLLCEAELIHGDITEISWKRWTKGRVALIGDAAHAMTPNLGQGAAMGIEDAVTLARLLSENMHLTSLKAFERQRKSRVRFIQNESRKTGQIGQWSSPAAVAFRRWLVTHIPEKLRVVLRNRLYTPVV